MSSETESPETEPADHHAAPLADEARHAEKMKKKKAVRDRMMEGKTIEKGLLIVHTGKGKGKSTAAFGMLFRALGHGMPVAVVQFVKGAMDTGETKALAAFGDLAEVHRLGEGFTWETQDRQRDIAAARRAWEVAKRLIAGGERRIVLLDELNIVLRYDYLPLDEVLAFLATEKPEDVHVVVTGRNAPDALIETADLVTEMEMIKHPFRSGVKAQIGIEF
ncbi:cob(I)yrinic acid a,c-diamide adenosyltransferase [Prosthecomicrobium pneumaticum]|uniref:Corrinoid adenosyltransferase n=1 Tax=Prosthecomicrobium pneumaticum TaxID=81895 RepID=A0A7W9FPN2_9HYPH|nr:cob(I)yrinic acid a,c-diamide adenosyltransferase [Prosthecomicrobium pneumaticum]MBB5754570.1 cob(I)alamin adenosyltransferase [Prosthecomicrobium pneumaticum]